MATEADRAGLEELRKAAVVVYFLNCAAKEAELERDRLISALVGDGYGGTSLASAAGMTRGWPGKIRDYFPPRYERWRAEHPDRLELLLEARKQLNRLIRQAKEG